MKIRLSERPRLSEQLRTAPLLLLFLLFLPFLPLGCGDHDHASTAVIINDGRVTVIIVDGPAASLDHLFIEVTRVSLLPAGGGDPVVIFEGNERIDLLRFREEDFLLVSSKEAPPGEYRKIRLEVGAVEVEPESACDGVKVPSGKIDLNPRGTFHLGSGEQIFVRLDIDANKSLQIHTTGNGGCIFRPVVFVDVSGDPQQTGCPRQLAGTIDEIESEPEEEEEEEEEDDLAELRIGLGGDRGSVEVEIEDDTCIFDAEARRGDLSTLKEGDRATLRAKGKPDGDLEALWVIAGDPVELEGTFETGIEDGRFTFRADQLHDCRLTPGAAIFERCGDQSLPPSEVVPGRQGRILGAPVEEGGSSFFRVAVIDLGPRETRGTIESVDLEAREFTLEGGATYGFDASTRIALAGDGLLTPQDLRPGEEVTVRLDSSSDHASEILVEPEEISGVIQSFDAQARTFILAGEPPVPDGPVPETLVQVAPEATVILVEGDDTRQVELAFLGNNDRVTLFGLVPALGTFDARTVVARR